MKCRLLAILLLAAAFIAPDSQVQAAGGLSLVQCLIAMICVPGCTFGLFRGSEDDVCQRPAVLFGEARRLIGLPATAAKPQ